MTSLPSEDPRDWDLENYFEYYSYKDDLYYGGSPLVLPSDPYTASDVGTADCSGAIQFVFVWKPDAGNQNEAPPAQVVVRRKVLCRAYDHYGNATYPKCRVDSGLGLYAKPRYVPAANGNCAYWIAQGECYELVTPTDPYRIPVSWSPFAHAESDKPGDSPLCDPVAEVYTRADVYVPIATPMSVTVAVTTAKVKGLGFDATNKVQEAPFGVKATVNDPPAGATFRYLWTGPGVLNGSLAFDQASASTAATSHTTTAHGSQPDKFYPACQVIAFVGGKAYVANDSKVCAAIGGPISTKAQPPSRNVTKVYPQDQNDPDKPFYLTYYGYEHSGTGKAADGYQPTMDGLLQVKVQPPGTEVSWTLPANVFTPTAAGKPNVWTASNGTPLQIVVQANGAFQGAAPVAHFRFNGDDISGTADDDSAVAEVQRTPGVWKPLVYKISGHQPDSLLYDLPAPYHTEVHTARLSPPVANATAWTDFAEYTYLLKDTFGDPMPRVWVQERFTAPVPPGFKINDANTYWVTMSPFTPLQGMTAMDGFFNGSDKLRYAWTVANPLPFTPTHIYYAGTSDPSIGATTGIPLGAYQMNFVPATGQVGTASQTKQP